MKLADFSVNRPVFITMIIVGMVMIGAILLPTLPIDLLPELELPITAVVTSYPGAAPEEVENLVTKPIEDAVSTIDNVDTVDSISQNGASMVLVSFNWGTDLDQAQMDMQKELDRITSSFPEDANDPLVLTLDPTQFPVVILGVSGEMPLDELQNLAEDEIVPNLEQVEGVASATAMGGLTKEIQVILDPDKMMTYGLTPGLVAQALSSSNFLATSGSVDRGTQELSIRFDAEMNSADDVRGTQINLPTGGTLGLTDVATVEDTFAEQTQHAYLNGEQVVIVQVMKASGGNSVAVSGGVNQALAELEPNLPEGVQIETILDQADFINDSIRVVVEHGILGGIIAVIVLFLFLADWRTTLVVALMLPVSIMATFTLMAAMGESLNILSLGGLLIGMGSLVDFAIVVIESIHRHRVQGISSKEGARIGTGEVTAAVTASALAQIAVFVPMLLSGGIASELFAPMALAVIFSHVAAWFGAITFVPMLASRFLKDPGVVAEQAASKKHPARYNPVHLFGQGIAWLSEKYRVLLRWGLNHRILVIFASFLVFFASLGLVPVIGAEFIPQSDQGQATVSVELPPASQLSETQDVVTQLEDVLLSYPEVDLVASTVGGTQESAITGTNSSHTASITVMMKPPEERERSTQEVMNDFNKQVEGIPGARITTSTSSMMAGSTSGVQVNVSGPETEVLEELGNQLTEQISSVSGISTVENSLEAARPEVAVYIDRQTAALYGVSVNEIQSAIQTALGGQTATRVRDGEDEIDVKMMFPTEWQEEYSNLENLNFLSSSGTLVGLTDVAQVVTENAPVTITRSEGQRQVQITATLTGERPLGNVSADVTALMEGFEMPQGYNWSLGGETEQMQEAFGSLALAIVLSIVLIYMIMAAQFESFFQPFVIMFCLPPTIVGALLGLASHGLPLSVTALIGVIMLIGVVMNNAIVLVDYTNTLRQRGYSRDEALLEAGPVRLRPILMTMLSTNLVLVPFAYGGGESSETMAPLAIVVIYGLLVSTLITLLLVPAVYSLLDGFFARLRRKKPTTVPSGEAEWTQKEVAASESE